MKKLKDLIYDYNDIFLALIIIIVAGAVIFWKVSDIMAYPSFAKNQSSSKSSTEVEITDEDLTHIEVDPIVQAGDDVEGGSTETSSTTQTESTEQTTEEKQTEKEETQSSSGYGVKKDTKFTVPSGYSGTQIANKLDNEKLCSKSDFTAAVTKLGAETKLRAGDFTLPSGSSAEDIVKIIANIK